MSVTVSFTATLKKFDEQGEKTGWNYIEVPVGIAQELLPGNKKPFRVKGKLDQFAFSKIALMPMGNGNFIMPVKATIRKAIGKQKGAVVAVKMQVDKKDLELPSEFAECLNDEPQALAHFHSLPKSQQHYFIRWISEAKTDPIKAKRIVQALKALSTGLGFAEMLRSIKKQKADQW
ncbi:MAG: hypothetical protein C4329_09020 [Chitinophagaceae bacterium]